MFPQRGSPSFSKSVKLIYHFGMAGVLSVAGWIKHTEINSLGVFYLHDNIKN